MRFKVTGNKKDIAAVVIKNADTIPIKAGAPVFLKGNGTDDGLAVVSSNNLAAAAQPMFFGLAFADVAVGAFSESQVFGYFEAARLRVTTRAASTDVWASFPAGALGDALLPVTGTGVVAASVSADQALSNSGSAAFRVVHRIRLGATYASATTQASSLTAISGGTAYGGATATAAFTTVKAFLRAM